jgi:hypothetical protein
VLVPGDRLRVGTTVLEVALTAAAGTTAAEEPADEPADQPAGPAEPSVPLAGVSGGSPEEPPGGAPGGPPPEPPSEGAGGPPPPPPEGAGGPPPPPPPGGGLPPAPEGDLGPAAPPPPPPGDVPSGAPSYPPVAYAGNGDYPIDFQADYPEAGIARWRAFFQGFLLIPHAIVLFFVGIGVLFAWIAAWFAILITGKYPRGIFDFIAGSVHWSNRYTGFQYWFTEQYPPFSLEAEPDYPVRTRIDYPPDGKIARWRVLVQGLLAIPHFIVIMFLFIAELVVQIIAFFSILFTRQWPRSMFDFTVGIIRWRTRAYGYGYYWFTEQYPPFSLD